MTFTVSCTFFLLKNTSGQGELETSQVAWWLRLCAPNAGSTGSISDWGTKSLHAWNSQKKPKTKHACTHTIHWENQSM